MEELTDREQEVFKVVCRYVSTYHNFPTFRWIIENTSITATSMVSYYMDRLVEKGWIIKKKVNGKHEYVINNSGWLAPYYMGTTVREDGEEHEYWLITNDLDTGDENA